MKKNNLTKTLVLLFAASFLVSGLFLSCGKQEEEKKPAAAAPAEEPKAPAAKKVMLEVPMAYPSALPGLGTTIIWMAERIELLSNNTMKIKIYEQNRTEHVSYGRSTDKTFYH